MMEDVLRAHSLTNVPMQKKESLAESFVFKCCFYNAASEVVKVLAGLAHLDPAAAKNGLGCAYLLIKV